MMSKRGFRRTDRGLFVVHSRNFSLSGWAVSAVLLGSTLQAIQQSFAVLLNPTELALLIQATTKLRYTAGIDTPFVASLASAYMLAYGVLAAAHCVTIRRIDWRVVLPLSGFVMSNILLTTRAPIVMLLICVILAAIFTDRHIRGGIEFLPFFTRRTIVGFGFVGVLLVSTFFYLQMLRFGLSSGRGAVEVLNHLRKYPWGSLPGFSLWFDGLVPATSTHFPGFYTFMGIFDSLGLEKRIIGGYQEYYVLTGDESGNIYTAIRGLVQDFGWFGSAVAMALLGGIGGISTSLSSNARLALALYVGIGAFFAYSFVVSFYAYASNLLALVLIPIMSRCFAAVSVKEDAA